MSITQDTQGDWWVLDEENSLAFGPFKTEAEAQEELHDLLKKE